MSSATIAIHAFLFFIFIYFAYTVFLYRKQRNMNQKKPPGPLALPIIGNLLHILGNLPHRTLHSLSKTYGPIMSLKLGQIPTIVVSSSKAAELFLKTHDATFASRPKTQASEIIFYGSKGLAFGEYGPHWRNMRKLCTMELLSTKKVELVAPIRREELGLVVKSLEKVAAVGQAVNLTEVVGNLTEDILYKMILGRNKNHQFNLKELVREALILLGAFNPADYVPWLGAFDLQGITCGCRKSSKEIDEVLEKIITEHEQASKVNHDFIDILLSMLHQATNPQSEHNDDIIDRTSIKAILLDMILAGVDTSAVAIEWALSELLRHPRVMKILQDEIQNEVGIRRKVEETDLLKLSYLDMVVDETLRLYPVAPLLVPRESRESITIDGYFIKKKSRVVINAWAIGRDPNVWSDNAETFYPERFLNLNKKINYQGQDFESIPFGSGRRRCPGIQLGLTTVRLVIAQLVHCFNWELPSNVSPTHLNMQEKFGLSMPRAHQLHAIPTYRLASDAI